MEIEVQRVAGASFRTLAGTFGISKDVICRHFAHHVSEKRKAELMAGPKAVEDLVDAAAKESKSALDYLRIMQSILFKQFVDAAEANDRRALTDLADPLLVALRDVSKLTGELRSLAGISITNNHLTLTASPEFAKLSAGLLSIARAHPEAKADIIALLRRLDEPQPAAGAPPVIGGIADAPRNGSALHGPLMRFAPVIECTAVEASTQ